VSYSQLQLAALVCGDQLLSPVLTWPSHHLPSAAT
jgi:hypothetical protein